MERIEAEKALTLADQIKRLNVETANANTDSGFEKSDDSQGR